MAAPPKPPLPCAAAPKGLPEVGPAAAAPNPPPCDANAEKPPPVPMAEDAPKGEVPAAAVAPLKALAAAAPRGAL